MIKDKIKWRKPDYIKEFGKISDEEINKMCKENSGSCGDIIIEKFKYGRKVTFYVYRIEKVGELIEGIETLSRQRLIQELEKLNKIPLRRISNKRIVVKKGIRKSPKK